MVQLPMKRTRQQELDSLTTMAKSLILLSHGRDHFNTKTNSAGRVFECKTCNRQFTSFQALGGHRASHKKPRLLMEDLNQKPDVPISPSRAKSKIYECSVCGLEFAIGQALGGHMRRHRAAMNENLQSPPLSPSLSPSQSDDHVLKKSNSTRVFCLDLNLTPLENHDLELGIEKFVPKARLVGFYDH